MKVSRLQLQWAKKVLFGAALMVAVGFQCIDFSQSLAFSPTIQFGCDLCLRRNEICCAHRGVNSFRVWNREIELDDFVPLERPDKPNIERSDGKFLVHSYPAWHTAIFYFFGWMPEKMCISLMSMLMGVCLLFICQECFRVAGDRFAENAKFISVLSLIMIASNIATSLYVLQYSVLLLAALFLINRSVEKNNDIITGLAWGIMMIKPQIGLLFFWPLFWRRRFLSIAVAAVFLLVATFAISIVVNESVIDLLLQITQIGKPYAHGYICDVLLKPLIGNAATIVCPALFFLLTGFICFLVRKNRDFLFNCLPVVAVIPLWTYSQSYDWGVLILWYIFINGFVLQSSSVNKWFLFGALSVMSFAFMLLWQVFALLGIFNPSGIGWIYRCVQIPFYLVAVISLLRFLCENRNGFVGKVVAE